MNEIITSGELISLLTRNIFGTYFIERNSFSKIYEDGSIGRTFFSDRSKQKSAVNATTIKKINILYKAVFANESTFDAIQITRILASLMQNTFKINAEAMQFYMDDTESLRSKKANGWLIFINTIFKFADGLEIINLTELSKQIGADWESIANSISQYSKGTFTEQIIKRASMGKTNDVLSTHEMIPDLDSPKEYFEMGCAYEYGEDGYVKNLKLARTLYQCAAEKGYPEAQYNYAICLLHGKGGDKKEKEAQYYMEKAANSGLTEAMYNLGLMYLHGAIERNAEKARFWLESAEKSGHDLSEQWIKCCILLEGLNTLEKVEDSDVTVRSVNSINDLVNAISFEDLIRIREAHIDRILLESLTDGIFLIVDDVIKHNKKEHEIESVKLWRSIQAALLFFVIAGDLHSFDTKSFISKTDGQLFLRIWEEQEKSDEKNYPYECRLMKFVVHQTKVDVKNIDFWRAIAKTTDLLLRCEKKLNALNGNKPTVSVHPIERICKKFKVEIAGLCLSINEDTDIYVRGTIEALSGYKEYGKLVVKAILYNKYGQVLYTLNSYSDMRLALNRFESFDLSCMRINRFIEVEQLHTINVYPSWKELERPYIEEDT